MWWKEIGSSAVAWPEQADEWQFHLAHALSGVDHLPGTGVRPGRRDAVLSPPDDSARCSLQVRPATAGIACTVFGEDAAGNTEDARRWHDAAEIAASMLATRDHDLAWRAILGPAPAGPDRGRSVPLAEPVTVGPVLLAPGGIQMRELAGYSRGSIDNPWPARYSW